MVNNGMPHAEIMKVTGHSQLQTFLRYVNLTESGVRESAFKFGEYLDQRLSVVSTELNLPAAAN